MGSADGDADEKPVRTVQIDSFYMARTETTVAEFGLFVRESSYRTEAEQIGSSAVWDSLGWHPAEGVHWRHDFRGIPLSPGDTLLPVTRVTWNDALQYCNWRSRREGLSPVYQFFPGDSINVDYCAEGYRLPTEAEWEYAVRSDKTSPAGSGIGAVAWYSGNSRGRVRETAKKKSNHLGIFDLIGNVWEWCQDRYGAGYYARTDNRLNPVGPSGGKERVLRGGACNNNAAHCRPSNRSARYADFSDPSVGFRVVRRTGKSNNPESAN